MIAALVDFSPFLLLFGLIVFFVILGRGCLGEFCEAIDRIEERLGETERRLEGIDKILSNYREWQGVVTELHAEFKKMREKAQRRDPLEAIVREQIIKL